MSAYCKKMGKEIEFFLIGEKTILIKRCSTRAIWEGVLKATKSHFYYLEERAPTCHS